MKRYARAVRVVVVGIAAIGSMALVPEPAAAEEPVEAPPVAVERGMVPVTNSEACRASLEARDNEAIDANCTADTAAGPSTIGFCWDFVEIDKIHIGPFGWFRQVWADYRSACDVSGSIIILWCKAVVGGPGAPPVGFGLDIANTNEVCAAQTFPFSSTFMGAPYGAAGRTFALDNQGRIYMTAEIATDVEFV